MSAARVTLPSLGVKDKGFRYRTAVDTDIRRTFARVKRERAEALRDAETGQGRLDLGTVVPMPARAGR
ncbi:hypothetical protein [Variovorax sp. YR216]|uniref:hypothetical protein n=1 Tax=Variovorax sp. YR216 TaxID=1882828 RepID=UPI00089AE326|nr:hypothetical protein [Variovorax sp. YR216]SEA49779.1 hypothetical protein SAMN05444680_102658 [Variovorax sp. YR216]